MKNINKQIVDLPDGKYNSLWSGGRMEILVPEKKSVYVETTVVVKGINCKTKVEIIDGLLSVIR